jgi:hypothetical protein
MRRNSRQSTEKDSRSRRAICARQLDLDPSAPRSGSAWPLAERCRPPASQSCRETTALLIADRILNDEDLRSAEAGAHTKAGYVVIKDDDFGFWWYRRNCADGVEGEFHEPNAVLARRTRPGGNTRPIGSLAHSGLIRCIRRVARFSGRKSVNCPPQTRW